MQVVGKVAENTLYIFLSGELDEYAANISRGTFDKLLDDNLNSKKVVFELSGLTFMDSTGIGMLIGRYKKLKRYQTPLFVRGASAAADKVLSVSGIYTLIPKI